MFSLYSLKNSDAPKPFLYLFLYSILNKFNLNQSLLKFNLDNKRIVKAIKNKNANKPQYSTI